MKRHWLFLITMLLASSTYAEDIFLDNQAFSPSKHPTSKMVIQWANSAKDVEAINTMMKKTENYQLERYSIVTKDGTIKLNIPEKAGYLRVLISEKGKCAPDFLTNWLEIEANKHYTIKQKHLVPAALKSGMGC